MNDVKWVRKKALGGLHVVYEATIDGTLVRVSRYYRQTKRASNSNSLPVVQYYQHNMGGFASEFKTVRDAKADAIKQYTRRRA